jgi:hemoglobin-like flavoprotein
VTDLVGAQLIITLRSVLGSEFTPDVEKAWTDIYSVVSAQMQAGVTEIAPVSLRVFLFFYISVWSE